MLYTCAAGCRDASHRHAAGFRAAAEEAETEAPARTRSLPAATRTVATARTKVPTSAPAPVAKRRGKSLVVDIHCHYLNPAVSEATKHLDLAAHDPTVVYANALTRETNVKQMKDRAPKLVGVENRIADMDRMGVDIQAVSPAPYHYFYFTPPDEGAALARQVNEGIATIVADHPDRFVGLGSVPLQNPELAVRELDYAVKTLGLRGVEINTNVNGLNLTDPALGLEPFFARASQLGIVIFLHPLGFTQADRLTNHYFNNVIGNPLDTTIAVSHLIFDGVVARNPKIKFVAAHAGGFIAHYWARMDHAWRARKDCRTVIKKKPSSYLEKFYFDTIAFDPMMLRHLIDRYGADHLLLGTDYPYDMGEDDPLGLVASIAKLPAAQRRQIEGLNAAQLLKIEVPR